MTENKILMKQAREALTGKWKLAIGVSAVYMLINIIMGSLKDFGSFLSLFISGPLAMGMSIFALSITRNKEARFEQLFEGFKRYGRSLAAYLLIALFTILWMLLLIIPGIIAAISYSQTFFILANDETVGAKEAINRSKKIMYGNKWRYFCLQLRFIGWGILSILTLGIGFLWLVPYTQVTMAKFFEEINIK